MSPTSHAAPSADAGLQEFERHRPRLFGLAYRMLGQRAEAEDLVQDVWLRWQDSERTERSWDGCVAHSIAERGPLRCSGERPRRRPAA